MGCMLYASSGSNWLVKCRVFSVTIQVGAETEKGHCFLTQPLICHARRAPAFEASIRASPSSFRMSGEWERFEKQMSKDMTKGSVAGKMDDRRDPFDPSERLLFSVPRKRYPIEKRYNYIAHF